MEPEIKLPSFQQLPIAALSDWLTLLQGPSTPLFTPEGKFDQEWKRLFRLVGVVLLMLGAIIAAFSLGLNAAGEDWQKFVSNSRYLFLVLVIGAVLAVPYAFMLAPMLRIKINLVQTFFSVLLLGLPWMPLVALIWAVGRVWTGGLVVTVFLYILMIVPLRNFCRGVQMISQCRPWQPYLSIMVPLVLALAVFVGNVVW